VSKRWLAQYKIEHTNVIGELHYEHFPFDQKKYTQAIIKCLSGENEICKQDSFTDANGETQWVSWEMQPWFTTDGATGGVVIFRNIITEQVTALSKLKHTEQQMRMLAEKVPALFAYVDKSILYLINKLIPAF